METQQKYKKGDRVRIVHIGSPCWEFENGKQQVYDRCPEAIGQVGEIVGSYDDLFPNPGREQNGDIHYEIKWAEGIKLHVAWWYEYQLEPEDINTPRDQQNQYPHYRESNTGKQLSKIARDIESKIMWATTADVEKYLLSDKSIDDKLQEQIEKIRDRNVPVVAEMLIDDIMKVNTHDKKDTIEEETRDPENDKPGLGHWNQD